MPQPLMDRMEIIRLSGYTEDEKLEIAKRHLMKKQLKDHGLKDDELTSATMRSGLSSSTILVRLAFVILSAKSLKSPAKQ